MTEPNQKNQQVGIVKPERPGGFLDFLPSEFLAREEMIRTIERIFRSFGFNPIETPRVEFLKTLAGETSDTGKNIFHIRSTQDDEPLAMPFDHTVPLARILAANPHDPKRKTGIRLPWRRMVVGPVFRADTPQSGRFRQFYQFDADIAGSTSMMADAEIVTIMYQTMETFVKDRFRIRINNRKILNGLSALAGIQDRDSVSADTITREMMRIMDKLDKIGLKGVIAALQRLPETSFDPAPNLDDSAIEKINAFLSIKGTNTEKLECCRHIFKESATAMEGILELEQILNYIAAMGVKAEYVEIDFSIARGLDYYTGPVFETVLLDAPQFGSVFSGGRYNNLVARFTGKELPATGTSIGVDRLFAALQHLKVIETADRSVTDVIIMRISPERDNDYLELAVKLRSIGLNTEISLLDDPTFKRQFNFALNSGAHFVIICGDDEFANQTIQIKNLATREQAEVKQDDLIHYFRQNFI